MGESVLTTNEVPLPGFALTLKATTGMEEGKASLCVSESSSTVIEGFSSILPSGPTSMQSRRKNQEVSSLAEGPHRSGGLAQS